MPVNVEAWGVVTRCEQEITPRWALAYSACMDLTTPQFLDDAQDGGPFVPPTFCTCLEWDATMATRTGLLGVSADERARGVHAYQRSEFLAPLRVGMQVETSARVSHMRQTSAGAYVLSVYEVRDRASEALLVRTWSGSMFRGVALSGPDRGEAPPEPDADLGADAHEVVLQIPAGQPHIYSECARIWNPIHTERAVALAAGLDGIIVHGSATWAMAGREVAARHGARGLRSLRALGGRFRKTVKPGERMTVLIGTPSRTGDVAFQVRNQAGEVAIDRGHALLAD